MLTAVIASTTAKPSMIFPRNRRVGSFNVSDCSPARFDDPTLTPRFLGKRGQRNESRVPNPGR
jgi:hypothetical protein